MLRLFQESLSNQFSGSEAAPEDSVVEETGSRTVHCLVLCLCAKTSF